MTEQYVRKKYFEFNMEDYDKDNADLSGEEELTAFWLDKGKWIIRRVTMWTCNVCGCANTSLKLLKERCKDEPDWHNVEVKL